MPKSANPSFVFITTSNMASGRNEDLDRLILSITKFAATYPINVKSYILLQEASNIAEKYDEEIFTVFYTPDRISLSAARNFLLRKIFQSNCVGAKDIVAFPDDDCWFPEKVLNFIYLRFEEQNTLDFFFCRYSANPSIAGMSSVSRANMQSVISYASSNTMFIRGRIVSDLGAFDERLGVGAPVNGGEDTDFAIRSFKRARKTEFLNSAIVGHRDYDKRLRGKYFAGSFMAIFRQGLYSPAGYLALFRKMLVGMLLLVKGELRLSVLLNAILAMVR